MTKNGIVIVIIAWLCSSHVNADAQNRKYLRIKERPIVRFDFDCTKPSLFPKSQLARKISTLRKKDWIGGEFENRAFAFDLNEDRVKEYFVPIGCGATGNCNWAIFSIKPNRYLGMINGENIYVHKRISRWSRLTVSAHINVSESMLETYEFGKGAYRIFGKEYLASAYRSYLKNML